MHYCDGRSERVMQHRTNLLMLNKYKLYHSNLAMFGVVTHYTDRNHLNLIEMEMGKVIIVNQSECKVSNVFLWSKGRALI